MTVGPSAIVIDPDAVHRAAVCRALKVRYADVADTGDVRAALELILIHEQMGLVIIDVEAIEQGIELACATTLAVPTPLVVAIHSAPLDAERAFALGTHGVGVLLRRPFTTDELLRAIDAKLSAELPGIVAWVAPFIGRVGLFDFETQVRRAMVMQAVMMSGESRSAAADLLRAPRPVIQRAAPPQIGRPRRRPQRPR